MLEENSDNTQANTSIELGKIAGQESQNHYVERLDIIPANEHDDEDDEDVLQQFQPVAFYFLKRDKLPRLLFVKLVSWPYPFMHVWYTYK